MKTFRFKRFYKVYMDYHFWFNFPPPQIQGVDFKETFILTIPNELILNESREIFSGTISEILNREHLDYNHYDANRRYEIIERIRLYDKEEYYPREQFSNIPKIF